jgi:hypothetical protein
MHHRMMRGERIGRAVGRAQHGIFDREAGIRGAQLHLPARLKVIRPREHAREGEMAQAKGLA